MVDEETKEDWKPRSNTPGTFWKRKKIISPRSIFSNKVGQIQTLLVILKVKTSELMIFVEKLCLNFGIVFLSRSITALVMLSRNSELIFSLSFG